MRLTVLGCWAPYPRLEEACSGYLVQSDSASIMLEAGHGSFAKLLKHIDYQNLTGIIITHYHPDHYADIHCLRHAIEGARRDKRMEDVLPLYIPSEPANIFQELSSFTDAFQVIKINDLPQVEIPVPKGIGKLHSFKAATAKLNDLTFFFVPITHVLPGYAVLICRNCAKAQESMFFSSDTAATQEITRAATGVNLLLCEASGLNKDATFLSAYHMTAGQAGALAREAKAEKLMLTHFWPEYNKEMVAAEAREAFGTDVLVAAQDLLINIP